MSNSVSDVLFDRFFNLVIRLEPENLHMDGEATPSEYRRRERQILKEWSTLEVEQGRRVDQGEIFDIYWQKRRNRRPVSIETKS